MNPKQKKMLYRILIAAALLVLIQLLPLTGLLALVPVPMVLLYLIPYLVVGWDVLRKAALGVKNRQHFDECFLMAVATVGAFALGEFAEGCAVILFYQIGELFQSVAVGQRPRPPPPRCGRRPPDPDGKSARRGCPIPHQYRFLNNLSHLIVQIRGLFKTAFFIQKNCVTGAAFHYHIFHFPATPFITCFRCPRIISYPLE